MSSSCWIELEFPEWETFTFDEWEDFTFTECEAADDSVATGTADVLLGTNRILVTQFADGRQAMNLSFNSSFVESDLQIFIGGIPITLASNGINLCPMFIIDNISDETEFAFVQQDGFYELERSGEHLYLSIVEDTPDENPATETMFNGMPLAMTSDKVLIAAEKVASGEADEETGVFWGGMPILAQRFGNKWYLTVTSN